MHIPFILSRTIDSTSKEALKLECMKLQEILCPPELAMRVKLILASELSDKINLFKGSKCMTKEPELGNFRHVFYLFTMQIAHSLILISFAGNKGMSHTA